MKPVLAALVLALAPALPAAAEPPSPVKIAELSARLYDAGMQARDPVLLLAAARLRKSLAPATTDRAPEGGTPESDTPLGWEEMLASAETLATGDDALLGLIADARVEGTKGVASGPVYNIASLGAGGNDRYGNLDFKGGEYAEVYVEAKSAVDLNLVVTDAKGRLVCSDTDISHIAYCGWRPTEAGSFTLTVENRGKSSTRYALMTN